jgi:hypothetical protein
LELLLSNFSALFFVEEYSETEGLRDQWAKQLNELAAQREDPLQAVTFLNSFDADTKPVLLRCDDAQVYVVKGAQAQHKIVSDQIVARLGLVMKAPVAVPVLVNVSTELIELEPRLLHFQSGLAHGTLYIEGCIDSYELRALKDVQNRSRFASLAILYGWVQAYDQQFLYRKRRPQIVYSVDHSHFFPFNPDLNDWDETTLRQAPVAEVDPYFLGCKLTSQEIYQALMALESVSDDDILRAVSIPPDEWGITMNERLMLVEYLIRRKRELLARDPLGATG